MLILAMLLCLLSSGIAQTTQQKPDGYLLPKYPPLAARALLNADYELALEIEQGSVKNVKVLSGQSNPDPSLNFIGRIEQAVRKWHFDMEYGAWRLKVSFRSFFSNHEEGKPTYYVFRANDRIDRVDVVDVYDRDYYATILPSEITIEYHFTVVADFVPAIKTRKRWWWPF